MCLMRTAVTSCVSRLVLVALHCKASPTFAADSGGIMRVKGGALGPTHVDAGAPSAKILVYAKLVEGSECTFARAERPCHASHA